LDTGIPLISTSENESWIKITPGGDTSCAHGDPFSFWFRPGKKDRLLVFFQGGGLCWDAETCAPGSAYYLEKVTEQNSPQLQKGIFDLKNWRNPFRRYSMLYIPYCTGDIHWGNHVRLYQSPHRPDLVIQHKGFVNASRALSYAFAQVPAPRSIFVTGCSAGSAGSILHTAYIIQQYPEAAVTQLGDSLAFNYPQPPGLQETYRIQDNFPDWIPALAEMSINGFRMVDFYSAVANYYPNQIFSQFNFGQDDVQDFFYQTFGGQPGSLAEALRADMQEIHSKAPNFRYYLTDGTGHCSLPTESFYSITNAGVQFRDWVTDLSRGKEVLQVQPMDSMPAP
jgi:hypothetical protein